MRTNPTLQTSGPVIGNFEVNGILKCFRPNTLLFKNENGTTAQFPPDCCHVNGAWDFKLDAFKH